MRTTRSRSARVCGATGAETIGSNPWGHPAIDVELERDPGDGDELADITELLQLLFHRGNVGWRQAIDVDQALEALAVELDGFQIQFEYAPARSPGPDGEEQIA